MTKEQLDKILKDHALWLLDSSKGKKANLAAVNLSGVNLVGADLTKANLQRANLVEACLVQTKLLGANLIGANLSQAYLIDANLTKAYLIGAHFRDANLQETNLSKANLVDANLIGAHLEGARLPDFLIVPEEGPFYAYKKLANTSIVTLYVPRSANRINSLGSRKCRVSKAKVVKIEGANEGRSSHDSTFKYEVGKWVKPNKFNNDIRLTCTNGIHCFITKKEAQEY